MSNQMPDTPADPAGQYPMPMVKGDLERPAINAAHEVALRFDGWRPADQPEPARGEFLPPPSTPPPAQPDAPSEGSGSADSTEPEPSGKQRRSRRPASGDQSP